MKNQFRLLDLFFLLTLTSCQPTGEGILDETQEDIVAEEGQEVTEESENESDTESEVESETSETEADAPDTSEEKPPVVVVKNHRGDFDGAVVNEISGLAFSRQYQGRIYVHNDSGDAAQFFVANSTGGNLQRIKLLDTSHTDYEDLAIGPCELKSCLFIGDIGDNGESRDEIKVIMVEEKEAFSSSVRPLKTLRLTYGDGEAHNAESLAVHPKTGDLFILTKNTGTAQMFKVSGPLVAQAKNGEKLRLKEIGQISFKEIFKGADYEATGMDISPDGLSFVVLTYVEVFEFKFDLSAREKVSTADLKKVQKNRYKVKVLPQQEAIAYDVFDHQIYYTTETGGDDPAPLLRVY